MASAEAASSRNEIPTRARIVRHDLCEVGQSYLELNPTGGCFGHCVSLLLPRRADAV